MYYGEIVAHISSSLAKCTSSEAFLTTLIEQEKGDTYTLHSLCADAGRIFEMVEDLCDDYFLDWPSILDQYTLYIKESLLSKKVPEPIDLYLFTAQSIEETVKEALKHQRG